MNSRKILSIGATTLIIICFNSCSKNNDVDPNVGTFTDSRDGKIYNTVKIGNQWWMAENLNHETENGCWVYDSIESNAEVYGRLYDWETALDVCPNGWHLPTDDEWTVLIDYLGDGAGGKMKTTDTTYWESPNTGATNTSGFSALPGGLRCNGGCTYFGLGLWATFWSSTDIDSVNAWRVTIYNSADYIERTWGDKNVAKSVRCIRD